MEFTQGDDFTMELTCQGRDITGATFQTKITDASGTIATFENVSHTIIDAASGRVNCTVAAAVSDLITRTGKDKDVVTKVTQSGLVTYYHGYGILNIKAKPA